MTVHASAAFNGSNYLSVTNYTGNPTAFSVSCWVYINSSQLSRIFFSNYNNSTGKGWAVGISDTVNNKVKFYLGGNTLNQSGTLSNNTWYNLVFTYDGTTASLYINGNTTPDATLVSAVVYSGTAASNFIGTLQAINQLFNGKIAALGYWSKSLSTTEITTLYNSGSNISYSDLSGSLLTSLVSYHDFATTNNVGLDSANGHNYTNNGTVVAAEGPGYVNTTTYDSVILADTPVSYWPLNEGSGTVATDAANSNTGTYTGIVSQGYLPIGPNMGQTVAFDGSTGYVTVPDAANLHLTGNLTLEAWVKTSSANSFIPIVIKNNPSSPFAGWGLSVQNGKFCAWVGGGSWVVGVKSINDGLWHHVVMTLTGTTIKLYVDSTLDTTNTQTPSLSSTQSLLIGRDTSGLYAPGSISSVAVYGSSLSSASIVNHINASGVISKMRVSYDSALAIVKSNPKLRTSRTSLVAINMGTPKLRVSSTKILAITKVATAQPSSIHLHL